MNPWDVLLGAGIVALVAFALHIMRRERRRGGCASCPYAGRCMRKGADGCEVNRG